MKIQGLSAFQFESGGYLKEIGFILRICTSILIFTF